MVQFHHRFYSADPPPHQERYIDFRPSLDLLAEITELAEKAVAVAGYEPITEWLEAIIAKAELKQKMLYQQILAGLLRRQAEAGVSPVEAMADFLKEHEGKKLSRKHVIILFLKRVCDWTNPQIEGTFGLSNVRQIEIRTKHKVKVVMRPKKGKTNRKGRSG